MAITRFLNIDQIEEIGTFFPSQFRGLYDPNDVWGDVYYIDPSGPSTQIKSEMLDALRRISSQFTLSWDEARATGMSYVDNNDPEPPPIRSFYNLRTGSVHTPPPFSKQKREGKIVRQESYIRGFVETISYPLIGNVGEHGIGIERSGLSVSSLVPEWEEHYHPGLNEYRYKHKTKNQVIIRSKPGFDLFWKEATRTVKPALPAPAEMVFNQFRSQFVYDNALITAKAAESNKLVLDALTALAEAPESAKYILGLIQSVSRAVRAIFTKKVSLSKAFDARKNRINRRYETDLQSIATWFSSNLSSLGRNPSTAKIKRLERAARKKRKSLERSFQRAQKESAVEFASALADLQLQYRYAIMPLVYQSQELWTLFNVPITFLTTRGGAKKKLLLEIPGFPAKEIDGGILNSVFIKRSVTNRTGPFGGSFGAISGNIAVTAWELLSYSFVWDWFINFGDFISSITTPTSFADEATMYSWKIQGSQGYQNTDGYKVEVNWKIYERKEINLSAHTCLTFKYDMNSDRYKDALALTWQQIRSDLVQIARNPRRQ